MGVKEKEDDVDNLFFGDPFCGEVYKSNKNEYLEEWLVDSGSASHITYTKNNLTNIEELNIYGTVRNGLKMKWELKVTVNIKLQGEVTVKFNGVLYIP